MNGRTIPARAFAPAAEKVAPLWVAAGLALGPAAVLGLGRFAYALLLPAMRADLSWSYADAGTMNSANALGYLVGALIAAPVTRTLGAKRLFMIGLLTTALMLGATGLTRSFPLLLTLRLLAGALGAFTFIAGAALTAASSAAAPGRSPLALGVFFVGPGLGIVISALAVPPVLAYWGWSAAWLAIATLSLIAAPISAPALVRARRPALPPQGTRHGAWPVRRALPLLIAYGTYGAGYIAYMTFIIAYLRSQQKFGEGEITLFWTILGLSGILGAVVWGAVLDRVKAARGTVLLTALLAIGSILPLLSTGRATAYLSAVVFGGVFLSIVTSVTTYVRRMVPPHAWASAIGLFTAMFAFGQCIGPILSGAVSDGVHGIAAGLWLSGAILASATVIALFQRETG